MAKKVSLVLSNWHHLIEGLQDSPQHFYSLLSEAIKLRQIPDAASSRIDYHEGGIFSAQREYFRVERNEYIFDVCAAPFGNSFFVSCWFGESRPSPLGPTVAAFALILLLIYFAGVIPALIIFVVLFFFLGALMSGAPQPWHRYLLVISGLGPLFERFFLPSTYYRKDTETMFRELVHTAVVTTVEQLREAKGLKCLSEQERKPISRDLLKR